VDCVDLLGSLDLMGLAIPLPVALAVVTTVGYVMGRCSSARPGKVDTHSKRELRRARCVARDLEKIARTVRKNLSRHHASVTKFRQRVDQLSEQEQAAAWKELCREAEGMLAPTMQLANQIANAYDQIRQQSHHLMAVTDAHTDTLTGVANRRRLDETLEAQLALTNRYDNAFSVVIFDVDHFKRLNDRQGRPEGDRLLQRLARLLVQCVRETDIVARCGGEQFAVVMPLTDLDGACCFAERWRRRVEENLPATVSGGVTTALDGDTPDSLLARADAAMYSAKSAGHNCVFCHRGEQIEPVGGQVLV